MSAKQGNPYVVIGVKEQLSLSNMKCLLIAIKIFKAVNYTGIM